MAVIAAACTAIFTKTTPDALRARVVKAALGEPDKAPRVPIYWLSALGYRPSAEALSRDWCGIFILWALHEAGLAQNVKWTVGEGFISSEHLPITSDPKPGDIAYFTKNQHMALVRSVGKTNSRLSMVDGRNKFLADSRQPIADSQIQLINGNGNFGYISQSTVDKNAVTAFYSIQPFIDQYLS